MSFVISVALLAAVCSLALAVPGMVLGLRRQAMLSDALSHAVVPGIAIGVMLTGTTTSPWLMIGATICGVAVFALTEWLVQRGRFTKDAATGLVFPVFFAIGVIIISTALKGAAISESTVLVGDLNFAALDHIIVGGYDIGPRQAWIIGVVGIACASVLGLVYRPLVVHTFDPVFAASIGWRARLVNYVVMVVSSLTVVASFDATGAVLVVALMMVPPATAMLVATTMRSFILLTLAIALISSQVGFFAAYHLDAATSPMMALIDGVIFLAVYACSVFSSSKRAMSRRT
ncbi:metal ABC transporter permease [Corynebacterium sp. SCR221107]|uniref:metal ABC transporter permease n=1 Tax=Corynebacterium sp. SCR221107 TaxID=3017361 RepID=UPI0022EC5C34|nr:metal ABC transporter permease [Corynebacterium sp. SCR221107]WBT08945.1 metal ABC transporter permease [Corynebacterium sp. SCR221107]